MGLRSRGNDECSSSHCLKFFSNFQYRKWLVFTIVFKGFMSEIFSINLNLNCCCFLLNVTQLSYYFVEKIKTDAVTVWKHCEQDTSHCRASADRWAKRNRSAKMAKTTTYLDKLVRFLKVESIYNHSSKLKSKATNIFGMFKFINSRVWH